MTNKLLPNHLIFSGGGVKGLCQIGVIKKLEETLSEKPISKALKLNAISGTSIGALVGTLCCLGYTADELLEETKEVNFEIFKQANFLSLIENYGFDNGMCLHNWFINLINKKLNSDLEATIDPTFHDIYKQTNIKLNITATSVNRGETHYFNYENSPDMQVSLAIRMSCGIPFIFETIPYENELYIDGCILDEAPCKYIETGDMPLIIKLHNRNETQYSEIHNIEDYSMQIMICLYKHICKLNSIIDNINEENTIVCNSSPISPIDFNINNETKDILFNLGYETDFSKLKYFKEIEKKTETEK